MYDYLSRPAFRELCARYPSLRDMEITFRVENTRLTTYCEKTRRVTDEKSVVSVSGGGKKAELVCSGEKSAFYALCALARRAEDGTLRDGESVFSPAFAARGYIEGFYGKPWTRVP